MTQFIGSQMFHWWQYYHDRNEVLAEHLDDVFNILGEAGIEAWEDSIPNQEYAENLGALLAKFGLKMPSVYANSTLHDANWEKSAESVIEQAKWAKALGATILISNPNPIDWNNPVDKTDPQLETQAFALNTLARELKSMGMTLAYHTHSPEMRQAAREFHHMMVATKEAGMMFCLDFHWVYRGAGNSHLAVEDVIELYGERVVTTHIRQSHAGVWAESLGEGDLDYGKLATKLKSKGYRGPLVIENAREQGTKIASTMAEAYSASRLWVAEQFQ